MLVVETIAKIRRAYFVDGRPIKAICRELGVSRKVVRKVIRSQSTEFRYERETQPQPKMGPWSAELDRLLVANESKAARERLTLIRLFEELRGLGYVGGYDAVRRYARRWSQERGASTTSEARRARTRRDRSSSPGPCRLLAMTPGTPRPDPSHAIVEAIARIPNAPMIKPEAMFTRRSQAGDGGSAARARR